MDVSTYNLDKEKFGTSSFISNFVTDSHTMKYNNTLITHDLMITSVEPLRSHLEQLMSKITEKHQNLKEQFKNSKDTITKLNDIPINDKTDPNKHLNTINQNLN